MSTNNIGFGNLEQLLKNAQQQQVSDIHIVSGNFIYYRIKVTLTATSDSVVEEIQFWNLAENIFNVEQIQKIKSGIPVRQFYQNSYGNFSISGYLTVQGAVINIRCLPINIPNVEKLAIPQALTNLCKNSDGLVLITGVTGSGKTTTLTSIVNNINQEEVKNIFVLESGITYLYPQHKSLIHHWEIGTHIPNFAQGILTAVENSADVIVINEMNDIATLDIALQAARQGVLVIAVMHSSDVVSTVKELLSFHNSQAQDLIRFRLANNLKAILSQRLVSTLNGTFKRAAIFDLLLTTQVIRNCILEGRIEDIEKVMQSDQDHGMLSMELELQKLLDSERISKETFTETQEKINSSKL